jgi:hypothetical protein
MRNENLNKLYTSADIAMMIKSKRMRLAERVAYARTRNAYDIWLKILKEREHSEELYIAGRIILNLVLRKLSGTV